MVDPRRAGVSEAQWQKATELCHELRVSRIVQETADARSLFLEVPEELQETFAYRAGQFLSFKIPYRGKILVRSYSLSSSPDCGEGYRIAIKRVDDGRISNWINDEVRVGDTLMAAPPAGLFVLNDKTRKIVFFAGGSGITPVISLIKTALLTTEREMKLIYANRDATSIIYREELEGLAEQDPRRLEIVHSFDDVEGFLTVERVLRYVFDDLEADFYLCGPGTFMDTIEQALARLHVPRAQIHIERFVSPPDPEELSERERAEAADTTRRVTPESISVLLDGETHEVPYQEGERVLHAARRAGLSPPFSCEEGYCSCCMAKLASGEVEMVNNDCLTPDLLEEGWVLTCQSVCVSRKVRIEYPD